MRAARFVLVFLACLGIMSAWGVVYSATEVAPGKPTSVVAPQAPQANKARAVVAPDISTVEQCVKGLSLQRINWADEMWAQDYLALEDLAVCRGLVANEPGNCMKVPANFQEGCKEQIASWSFLFELLTGKEVTDLTLLTHPRIAEHPEQIPMFRDFMKAVQTQDPAFCNRSFSGEERADCLAKVLGDPALTKKPEHKAVAVFVKAIRSKDARVCGQMSGVSDGLVAACEAIAVNDVQRCFAASDIKRLFDKQCQADEQKRQAK